MKNKLKNIMKKIDKDKSGTISIDKFMIETRALGIFLTENEM